MELVQEVDPCAHPLLLGGRGAGGLHRELADLQHTATHEQTGDHGACQEEPGRQHGRR